MTRIPCEYENKTLNFANAVISELKIIMRVQGLILVLICFCVTGPGLVKIYVNLSLVLRAGFLFFVLVCKRGDRFWQAKFFFNNPFLNRVHINLNMNLPIPPTKVQFTPYYSFFNIVASCCFLHIIHTFFARRSIIKKLKDHNGNISTKGIEVMWMVENRG